MSDPVIEGLLNQIRPIMDRYAEGLVSGPEMIGLVVNLLVEHTHPE